jgi:D-alanyl-D-alanine carboxypeptidase/D-alanyl-D-alanine-endopeptidase (penicillin-binding protein 4)
VLCVCTAIRGRTLRLTAVACGVLLWVWAQPALASDTALANRIAQILADRKIDEGDLGVHVIARGSDRVIHSRNAERQFIAASNVKLVTAIAALETLGRDYEFETAIYPRGAVEDGHLRGDLILRGGGDPTIGGRHDDEDALTALRRWAQVLAAKGLRRISGDIVADDTFFDRTHRHPHWDDYPAWKWHYTTTSALSVNDNCVTITVKPGTAPGRAAVLSMRPASAPLEVRNLCKTATKKHAIWFDRSAGSNTIKVGGFVRKGTAGYSHEVTVPNPPLYAAAVLKEALEAEGIAVGGAARLIGLEEAAPERLGEPLFVRRTRLLPVLRRMVMDSHNHYAEQVLKTVGAETSGRGTWEAGLSRAASVLRDMGFRDEQFHLGDGSGLSRQNKLTPAFLAGLLAKMRRPEGDTAFGFLLPWPGREGTLRKRLLESPYLTVRAKTGYLNGVGALSGYATTLSGFDVAFCILINDDRNPPGTYSMRETVDDICRAIVDHAQ